MWGAEGSSLNKWVVPPGALENRGRKGATSLPWTRAADNDTVLTSLETRNNTVGSG